MEKFSQYIEFQTKEKGLNKAVLKFLSQKNPITFLEEKKDFLKIIININIQIIIYYEKAKPR